MPQRVPVTKKFLVRSPAFGHALILGLSVQPEVRIQDALREIVQEIEAQAEEAGKPAKVTLRGLVRRYLKKLREQ